MRPTLRYGRICLTAAVLAAACCGVASAQAPAPKPGAAALAAEPDGAVIVPLNRATPLRMKTGKNIVDAFNDSPSIVVVSAVPGDPTSVLLLGRAVGVARVTLTDAAGAREIYEVLVQPDIELLRKLLKSTFPLASLRVTPAGGTGVIIDGLVPNAEDIQPILQLADLILGGEEQTTGTGAGRNVINRMRVGGVHQVQLDVVIAQVSRTQARNRAFSFGIDGTTVTFASFLGGTAIPAGAGAGGAGGMGGLPVGQIAGAVPPTNLAFGILPANIGGFLQTLKTDSLAKLLSEPRVVTRSGRTARLLSGGRQAVLGASSGINGPGVEFEDIGTELEVLPIVYGDGRIYLEVAPRVRAVNAALGVQTVFGFVPGFDEQSIRTSVVMRPGQTFAIGGLIQTSVQGSSARVPVLGDIPIFGSLFSSVNYTRVEQELVILVTPHLVDAMDCSQLPTALPGQETRHPSDFELFAEQLLELPRGKRQIFVNGRYQAGYKTSPTYRQYPCVNGSCGVPGRAGNVPPAVATPTPLPAGMRPAPVTGGHPLPAVVNPAPAGTLPGAGGLPGEGGPVTLPPAGGTMVPGGEVPTGTAGTAGVGIKD